MKLRCVRKVHFCSGHRVMNHESKCAKLHGHNYIAWLYAEAEELDDIGRIIDFSILKDKIGGWIESNWDHKTILFVQDIDFIASLQKLDTGQLYLMESNPTAENMAKYLLNKICPILLNLTEVKVTKVKLYETENCYAEAEL